MTTSDKLDGILRDYIAEHADGFFGKGKPSDAIQIREKAKQRIIAWALEAVGEDEVFANDKVHSVKQQDRKFIIRAKQRNQLRAELRKSITGKHDD